MTHILHSITTTSTSVLFDVNESKYFKTKQIFSVSLKKKYTMTKTIKQQIHQKCEIEEKKLLKKTVTEFKAFELNDYGFCGVGIF